MKKMTEVVTV